MTRKRILIAESRGFPPAALERLRGAADVMAADLDRSELERSIGAVEILWIRLRHLVDNSLLSRAPSLEAIATPTTGLTHIDLDAVERRGIRLLCLRGETDFLKDIRATAEHTIGLMLALLRHLPEATAHVREGGWNRDLFQGAELFGKTIAVVGYGRLGRIVARYLAAFGCRVLAVDPHVGSSDAGVELVPIEDALRKADLVTLHVNLTPESRQFFGARQYDAMKPGSYFINTSRGELVDEGALLGALRSGRLAGAALDVLSGETSAGMASHPLTRYARDHSNLLITPHVGGCTKESLEKTELFLCDKLLAYMASGVQHQSAVSAAI